MTSVSKLMNFNGKSSPKAGEQGFLISDYLREKSSSFLKLLNWFSQKFIKLKYWLQSGNRWIVTAKFRRKKNKVLQYKTILWKDLVEFCSLGQYPPKIYTNKKLRAVVF